MIIKKSKKKRKGDRKERKISVLMDIQSGEL